MSLRHRRRLRLLTTALLATPIPALATTYTLSNQTVSLSPVPYTADDTLDLTNVTFTATGTTARTLPATLNLLAGTTTFSNGAPVTLTGPLLGSASLTKTGTGTLTIAASSPSYSGNVTVSSGTLRLDTASPFASPARIILESNGTFDFNGRNSAGTTIEPRYGILANNNTGSPVTIGASQPLALNYRHLELGGSGDITFAATLPTSPNLGLDRFIKTGTGTVTMASPGVVNHNLRVSAGTLRLGIESPFTGSHELSIDPTGTLDLNGFNSPGTNIAVASGGQIVNSHPTATSTLSKMPAGTVTFGSGNVNLTAKPTSLTKTGTGTLTLSAPHTSFTGTITVLNGTVRLNAPLPKANFVLGQANSTVVGVIDLNGFAAPAGDYSYNGLIVNENLVTPATLDFSAVSFGGDFNGSGEIITSGNLPSNIWKRGNGTLTLPSTNSYNTPTIRLNGGKVRLRNAAQGGVFDVRGSTSSVFLPAVIDLNGVQLTQRIDVTLYNNAGFVNDNADVPVTLDWYVAYHAPVNTNPPLSRVLGGNGTLHVSPGHTYTFDGRVVHKIGTGLVTLPTGFRPKGFRLHAGTVQIEVTDQLGFPTDTTTFLGGSLRIAPLHLPAQTSYTFPQPLTFDTPGGTIDTQRNTTLTGSLTGPGTLNKSGPATLTLTKSPSNLPLNVQSGMIRFAASLAAPLSLPTLTIADGATLDLSNNPLTTSTPAETIRQYLLAGRLVSSTPDPSNAYSLAFVPTNSSLLVKLALTGDANADGLLNADDYALLDKGFASAGSFWWDGDFDYDGQVTSADYLLLDAAVAKQQGGQLAPALFALRQSQFGTEYVSQLLVAIPEPSALTCLFATFPFVRRRR